MYRQNCRNWFAPTKQHRCIPYGSLTGSSYTRPLRVEALEDRRLLATTVDTLLDTVDVADGFTSLREAIAIVNATSESVIDFSVTGAIKLTGGELEITDTLTITGPGQDLLMIDAQQQSRVLIFSAITGDLAISDLTITGGQYYDGGGGIRFDSDGALTLTSSTVSGNVTMLNIYAKGGGIYTHAGSVRLISSTVSGNSSNGEGAGIFTQSGNVSLTNSTVGNNSTIGQYASGGGISTFSGSVSLTSSTVSGNSTSGSSKSRGGGIHTVSGSVSLTSSTVSGNSTSAVNNARGGGIFSFSGQISLLSSTVSGNSTSGFFAEGGGLFASSGNVSLTSSTVSGNSTAGTNAEGGGIYMRSGSMSLAMSTVTGNVALGAGGGIYVFKLSANPSLTIENSIVASNTTNTTGHDIEALARVTTTINHSLIGIGDGLTVIGNVGNRTGTAANPLDPLLGPLTQNGGPTRTHALQPGSPALNAGDPNYADSFVYDQRGFAFDRVVEERIDIGAYEFGATSADFDTDGDIDGVDFLTWQRGFGIAPATHLYGDANLNGTVEATDLSIWSQSFGQSAATPLSGQFADSTESTENRTSVTGLGAMEVADKEPTAVAIALEWLGNFSEKETEIVARRATPPASLAASGEPNIGAPEPTSSLPMEYESIPAGDEETDDAKQPWLSEELLDRVFG